MRTAASASVDVHDSAEMSEDLFGAAPAGFVFQKIAGFTSNQLDIVKGHGPPADPLVAIAQVNVIEFGHGYLSSVNRKEPLRLQQPARRC